MEADTFSEKIISPWRHCGVVTASSQRWHGALAPGECIASCKCVTPHNCGQLNGTASCGDVLDGCNALLPGKSFACGSKSHVRFDHKGPCVPLPQ